MEDAHRKIQRIMLETEARRGHNPQFLLKGKELGLRPMHVTKGGDFIPDEENNDNDNENNDNHEGDGDEFAADNDNGNDNDNDIYIKDNGIDTDMDNELEVDDEDEREGFNNAVMLQEDKPKGGYGAPRKSNLKRDERCPVCPVCPQCPPCPARAPPAPPAPAPRPAVRRRCYGLVQSSGGSVKSGLSEGSRSHRHEHGHSPDHEAEAQVQTQRQEDYIELTADTPTATELTADTPTATDASYAEPKPMSPIELAADVSQAEPSTDWAASLRSMPHPVDDTDGHGHSEVAMAQRKQPQVITIETSATTTTTTVTAEDSLTAARSVSALAAVFAIFMHT